MKRLISIILIAVLIMCGAACDNGNKAESTNDVGSNSSSSPAQEQTPSTPEGGSNGTPAETPGESTPVTPVEKTVYELLDELSRKTYSAITLNITTLTGDIELKAEYTMTSSRVTYSVEQLNLLPEDGDISNADPNFKTTLTGEAVIENGSVTTVDGAAVTLPSYDELKGEFSFSEANLTNVKTESGSFSADVVSPKEFLGTDKSLSSMKVSVEYTDNGIQSITVTYDTSLSSVTLKYEFKS